MIKRTSIAWLIALALIGVAIGWVLVRIVDTTVGRILGVPTLASLGLWALAIGVFLWAVISRPRLVHPDDRGRGRRPGSSPAYVATGDPQAPRHGHPERMPPLLAALQRELPNGPAILSIPLTGRDGALGTVRGTGTKIFDAPGIEPDPKPWWKFW